MQARSSFDEIRP